MSSRDALLKVKELKKYFPIRRGFFRLVMGHVKAVDRVSFEIRRGETLGLVGESGCGKTTLGRLLLRAIEPTDGKVVFVDGENDSNEVDVTESDDRELRLLRKRIQLIFQDPFSSLNPRMTTEQIIAEPLLCYGMKDRLARKRRVSELLELVGLNASYAPRYPHAFSGGQRQRIGIARAIALNPDLIIADEAVSALDVSIQAQILNLLQDLQDELGLTYLFISHDLGVVQNVSDRVAVMYVGGIVELGDTAEVFANPKHPYVEGLLSSVPRPDPSYRLDEAAVSGEVADPSNRPSGCPFHPRCVYAQKVCTEEQPKLKMTETRDLREHWVACHFAEELQLKGVGG